MTSLESTSSHLSARMSNPQGSLLTGKPAVGSNGSNHHLSSHKPASSSSSSSASIFDAFAPLPGAPTSAQTGSNGSGASQQQSGHRQSASMHLPALKSPVVGGPSSTSPSAASAFDALASQFANASLGPNSVSTGPRVQHMHEHQSISPLPHYPQHVYPGHPSQRGHGHASHYPGHHPHPRHSSQQPHHNPNPAVSTMWPRRHGVVKFFNSTKG